LRLSRPFRSATQRVREDLDMTEVFMMSDRQNKLQERPTFTFIISAYRQRSEGVNVVPIA
jgi:hypothetical protein